MMEKQPKVSIITPTYNREKFIGETLECLQNLKYQNWECIVMDDDSTDNSATVILEMAKKDDRIKYFHQSKSLLPVTKNNAIAHSTGKYILPLDSDDLIAPEYISEAVEILEKKPEVKLVYCRGVYFGDKKGKWKLEPYSYKQLLIKNCIHNTALFRRADFDKTSGYNPNMTTSEDWDLWISLLETGGEVCVIEKDYFFYRKHKDSFTDNNQHKIEETQKLIYLNHREAYNDLLSNPIKLLQEHNKYKKGYNQLRRLTFRKQIP